MYVLWSYNPCIRLVLASMRFGWQMNVALMLVKSVWCTYEAIFSVLGSKIFIHLVILHVERKKGFKSSLKSTIKRFAALPKHVATFDNVCLSGLNPSLQDSLGSTLTLSNVVEAIVECLATETNDRNFFTFSFSYFSSSLLPHWSCCLGLNFSRPLF